jgi:UDP-arabinose 4-epimerase
MGTVLVTGGAGYIGSHTAKAVAATGTTPVTLDTLENGHRDFVRWGPLVVADVLDRAALDAVFDEHRPEAVLHFAGLIDSADSVAHPDKYFRTNVEGTRTLLSCMETHNVTNLVFSSSAAVYGNDHNRPIRENDTGIPATPYGQSKYDSEAAIRHAAEDLGLRWTALRYFNAAGASAQGEIGEAHDPETHLVPLAIAAAVNRTAFRVFGTDYDTPDGTSVRDFVHVEDLADAHVRALGYLSQGGSSDVFNLGAGQGASVLEVLREVEIAVGKPVETSPEPRRPGDAPQLVADWARAAKKMGWRPDRSGLDHIVSSAWQWHRSATTDQANK